MSYRILIADDALMNRMLIKRILEQSLENCEFEEAEHGKAVLEIVHNMAIDLIILDLIMPVMDGYETLKYLKDSPEYHDIPVIVNSAITEIRSIEETLKVGAIDYFTKPLSQNDMNIILPLKAKNALLLYEQNRTIIDLNKKINEELKNANTFANIMLPNPGSLDAIDLFIKYHPSLGIGGDFFDCVEVGNKVHFMVADVTGHGIAAGMASSMVKVLYRKSIEKNPDNPHDILQDINNSIFSIFDFAGKDNYVVFTAFVGILEDGLFKYANAGHPYPLIFRKENNQLESVDQNGFLVGMLNGVAYESQETKLERGDAIFLYTDGLFCTGHGNDFTGWQKVFTMAQGLTHTLETDPDDFLDILFYGFHMIHKSNHLDFTDDVALMLLKLTK